MAHLENEGPTTRTSFVLDFDADRDLLAKRGGQMLSSAERPERVAPPPPPPPPPAGEANAAQSKN